MFSNQGPAQEDLRARGLRRNVSEGVGGPPFLRDGPMVPCGPPDPGPLGKPSVPCGEARSRHAPLAPRPRKPRGRPKDPISPPTRESRRPPWDWFPSGLLPTGLSPVWLGTDHTQQGQNARGSILRPLCMPPPQQAARYPERARRGEGYRKARAFGEKGIAPGPSGLYHYFGRRTEIAGPYRNARET